MRCSAIIEEAVSRDIECVIVGRLGGLDWVEARLKAIRALHFEDQGAFQIALGEDVLVIDSYDIPITDRFIQPNEWRLVVSISDDVTPTYAADLVIHPSIDFIPQGVGQAKLITGAKYIPFRKSISKSKVPNSTSVGKVVVFGGGSDQYNFALFMAQGLAKIEEFESAVFFSNSHSQIKSLDSRFEVKNFGPLLDAELDNAALVFTTASTSSLEIIAREIPLGVCCVAENQVSYFEALTKNQLAAGIGRYNPAGNWEIDWIMVTQLLLDSDFRRKLLETSKGFVDLLGSQRIVDEILTLLN